MRSTVRRMSSTCDSSSAIGFSTNTALPASSALHTNAACERCRVTTKTASIAGSSRTSSALVPARSNPNFRCALTADSDRVVATDSQVGLCGQVREQHGRRVAAGADEPDADRTPLHAAPRG